MTNSADQRAIVTRFGLRPVSIALLAVVMLALVLRLYHLGVASLWLDEIGQVRVSMLPFQQMLAGVERHKGAAPLDYIITGIVARLARAEWALRMPAAIWGVLAVYWTHRVGRRTASSSAGLIAALLLTLSPLHVRYSQEVRFYSLFVFLALVCTELLWIASEKRSWRWWGLYAVAMTLCIYTHYDAALLLIYHGLACIVKWVTTPRSGGRKRLIHFGVSSLAVAIAFLPWVSYAVLRETGESFFRVPTLDWILIGAWLAQFGANSLGLGIVLAVLAGTGAIATLRSDPAHGVLLTLWAFASPFIVVLQDMIGHYFFNVRQILFALPPLLILSAVGLLAMIRGATRLARSLAGWNLARIAPLLAIAATLALSGSMVAGLRSYYLEFEKEDWRAVADMLRGSLRPGDTVMLLGMQERVGYYFPEIQGWTKAGSSPAELERQYREGRGLWVLDTRYIDRIGENAKAVRAWLAQRSNLDFRFGNKIHLYFLQQGRDLESLWTVAEVFAYPGNAELWYSRARILLRLGELAQAQEAFAHAAELTSNPDKRARFLSEATLVAYQRGEDQEGLVLYQRVAEIWPQYASIPEPDWPSIAYDFFRAYDTARIDAPSGPFVHVQRIAFAVGGDTRLVIMTHPPANVRYSIRVPRSASLLWTSLAVDPQTWGWGGDGVTFWVDIIDRNGTERLFTQHVGIVPAERRWHEVEIDITRYRGQDVDVVFGVDPGPAGDFTGDRGGWATPLILR